VIKVAVIVLLALALAASVAAGLTGLWPNLRDRGSMGERRERTRIASAFDEYLHGRGKDSHVIRVRLDYVTGQALVQATEYGHTANVGYCVLVAEHYGAVLDRGDWKEIACDF
jgi:hypothetical protein